MCATFVCFGALGCGESSSPDDGESASGGTGGTSSSGSPNGGSSGQVSTGGQSGTNGGGASTGGSQSGTGGGGATTGGSASGEAGTNNGGSPGGASGAGTGTGANAGTAGNSTGGGAGASTGVVSEPPTRVTRVDRGSTSELDGLEITHSHFYIDAEAALANTWTWLAVVRSRRSDIVCELTVEGDFITEASAPIKIHAPVAAPPHRSPSSATVFRCVPPGGIGVASGAALDGRPQVMPTAVTEIQYSIEGIVGTNYVPGEWMSIGNVTTVPVAGGTVVRGTFTNGDRQMPWWEANVCPMDTRGLPLVQFVIPDTSTSIPPGGTWNFETPVYDGEFDDAYVFVRHARPQ